MDARMDPYVMQLGLMQFGKLAAIIFVTAIFPLMASHIIKTVKSYF